MNLAFLSFTDEGEKLAHRLAKMLGGSVMRCGRPLSLREWTRQHFASNSGLIFVGAVGIAVRAIAPYVDKKWTDPAVVAVDEGANFAVPLLSGHLGGANHLARRIQEVCGAQAVITTATDVHGTFAVDEWARCQGLSVENPTRIRAVSGKILAGGTVTVQSRWPILGDCPPGVALCTGPRPDVQVDIQKKGDTAALCLVPNIVVLGIGCRKGTSFSALETAWEQFSRHAGLYESAICAVSSIDLKKDEPGLLAFCRHHGWPFMTFPADALRQVPGTFTPSSFVEKVTGVDNVCERSAVAASGGEIVIPKWIGDDVTLAAAQKPLVLSWRWQDEPVIQAPE